MPGILRPRARRERDRRPHVGVDLTGREVLAREPRPHLLAGGGDLLDLGIEDARVGEPADRRKVDARYLRVRLHQIVAVRQRLEIMRVCGRVVGNLQVRARRSRVSDLGDAEWCAATCRSCDIAFGIGHPRDVAVRKDLRIADPEAGVVPPHRYTVRVDDLQVVGRETAGSLIERRPDRADEVVVTRRRARLQHGEARHGSGHAAHVVGRGCAGRSHHEGEALIPGPREIGRERSRLRRGARDRDARSRGRFHRDAHGRRRGQAVPAACGVVGDRRIERRRECGRCRDGEGRRGRGSRHSSRENREQAQGRAAQAGRRAATNERFDRRSPRCTFDTPIAPIHGFTAPRAETVTTAMGGCNGPDAGPVAGRWPIVPRNPGPMAAAARATLPCRVLPEKSKSNA